MASRGFGHVGNLKGQWASEPPNQLQIGPKDPKPLLAVGWSQTVNWASSLLPFQYPLSHELHHHPQYPIPLDTPEQIVIPPTSLRRASFLRVYARIGIAGVYPLA